MKRSAFSSWLAPHLDHLVAVKRAGGASYASQVVLLRAFDRHLTEQVARPPLSREHVVAYLASLARLSPRARDNAISAVWQALAHARHHGAPVEALPCRPAPPPAGLRVRQPRILSAQEFQLVVATARQLYGDSPFRTATIVTLLGLLYTTGIRIGEALALDVHDLDIRDHILTVRRGKFGKARALPLRVSVVAALQRYWWHPDHPRRGPLFASTLRRRLAHPTAWRAFRGACRAARITLPLPRLHDLRHTFAVRRVVTWYAGGRDVNRLLPALSTYLGHVSVENTRCYLRANGLLLEQAAARFARQTTWLDRRAP